jgi:hypothetical protein
MNVKIFRVSLTVVVLLSFSQVFSQDYAETALLFSRTRPGGSARIQALGGSQIALGGDYSSSGSNPAGLGMFNKSEFTISAGLTANTTSSFFKPSPNFEGLHAEDDRTVFNIPGISLVWHMPKENGKFLGGSLAISMSRTNDFNRATFYRGNNDQNSIVDYFMGQANGATTAQFDEGSYNYNTPTGLAYFNYLIGAQSIISPSSPDDEYFTDAGWPEEGQQEEILVKGATNQWNFSYGGNIDDKFFFGGGLGISSLRYKSQKIFTEYYSNPDTIESMQLNENLDIRGTGVNVTLGAIVRPFDFVQVGVSYTTPTFYNLSENYEASMSTRWNNFDYYGDGDEILNDESAATDLVTSDYNLRIPSRFSTGITFLSKYGFITGEVELTNPGKAKYSSDTPGISYTDNNDDIKAINRSTVNYRMGAEFRYDIYRLRAGFGVQSNSYRKEFNADNQVTTISGGAGIRLNKFYIDFALISNSSGKYYYQPYTFSDGSGPVVDLESRVITGMITAGFTF